METPTPDPSVTVAPDPSATPDVLGALVHLSAQAEVLTTAVVVFGILILICLGIVAVRAIF